MPNVIVYECLKDAFDACRILHELPLTPPEWRREFALQSILGVMIGAVSWEKRPGVPSFDAIEVCPSFGVPPPR
ncbi:MAG: hypothetical protein GXP31_03085 [Kiritimatiellaeota bacterium]|nr:hypothetical protein [Kiritimatiellota bacterium]